MADFTQKSSYAAFLTQTFGLAGKTVVVAGGGGTLCGAMAKGFVLAGANVVLWGRTPASLEANARLVAESVGDAAQVSVVRADLSNEGQIEQALGRSVEKFGRVDVLLNGVGGSSVRRPFVEAERADFEAVLLLNLMAGCILPTQHLARYWIGQKLPGSVINIASMSSYVPLSGAWAYSAAKAAVVNQTMAHAREFAAHGIRVNALAPGFFLGKQNRRLLIGEDGAPTPRGQAVLAHTPMGRFGDPADLMGAAIFLASDASSFISGVTLPVDGAFLCHSI